MPYQCIYTTANRVVYKYTLHRNDTGTRTMGPCNKPEELPDFRSTLSSTSGDSSTDKSERLVRKDRVEDTSTLRDAATIFNLPEFFSPGWNSTEELVISQEVKKNTVLTPHNTPEGDPKICWSKEKGHQVFFIKKMSARELAQSKTLEEEKQKERGRRKVARLNEYRFLERDSLAERRNLIAWFTYLNPDTREKADEDQEDEDDCEDKSGEELVNEDIVKENDRSQPAAKINCKIIAHRKRWRQGEGSK
ncbi:hypothetical protein B0I73DRAFT_162970 [Yarrowia lipolytica]|nr:hypothetical protein B0I73DRAFT_162970 [Yarrowia lipolytica]